MRKKCFYCDSRKTYRIETGDLKENLLALLLIRHYRCDTCTRPFWRLSLFPEKIHRGYPLHSIRQPRTGALG